MNQEITLSSGIVTYLYNLGNNPFRNDIASIINVIEQNYIISDSDRFHFQQFTKVFDELPNNSIKEMLRDIVDNWIQNKKKFIKINSIGIPDEFCLAGNTSDKILYSPNFTRKDIRKNITDIELHDSDSFIVPEAGHRLKNCPSSIVLNDGSCYDIAQILNPFLREANYVKVKDPYLPNKTARNNLKKLFGCIKNTAKIELICLNKGDYIRKDNCKEDEYDEFNKMLFSEIKRGSQIKISDYKIIKRKHIERYIYTDRVAIYIPGGLDFIDDSGFYHSYDTDDEKEKAAIRISFK